VRGLLVPRRIVRRAVQLDQQKPRRVVVLLDDVEAHDAGLLHAVARILERRGGEGVHGIGLHVDEDVDDEHGEYCNDEYPVGQT
jgi:hypothetical protein